MFQVRGVIVLLDELISVIRSDQKSRNRKRIDEPLSMDFNHPEQSTSGLNGQFISSQLLIDCLLRMQPNSTDLKNLISFCQKYYKANALELQLLSEFEKMYSSENVLWWYTREACFYRLMNKALRVLHIDTLYLFGFFIRDLHKQLEERKCSKSVSLYRCQLMSKDEIELLRKSVGNYIAMNSYFSTSINRNRALAFLDDSSDLEKVLFEIEANPHLEGVKPFANIASKSYYPEEEEILFAFGSIFQLKSVACDDEQYLWTIQLELGSSEQHDSTPILNQMKSEYPEGKTSAFTYGNILRHMGRFNEAERYYRRFLEQTSPNSNEQANCYHSLGSVACAKGKYDESLQWHFDALEIKLDLFKREDPNLATSYNNIAIVYRNKGDYPQALDWYKESLIIWKNSPNVYYSKVAACLNNIGVVYEEEKDYSKAKQCYQTSLEYAQKCQPMDYRVLSATYNNLGKIHEILEEYDPALEYYTKSHQMKLKFLPESHPNIHIAVGNIERIGQKKRAT